MIMDPQHITLHCSATNPANPFTKEDLHRLHVKVNGWSDIGYHFYIDQQGCVHDCRPLNRRGAHVKDHNTNNIGVCLEGGINAKGKATYNFSVVQMDAAKYLVQELSEKYNIPVDEIKGHRDWFPDLNCDGVIDHHDWLKECPCYDVKHWVKSWWEE